MAKTSFLLFFSLWGSLLPFVLGFFLAKFYKKKHWVEDER
jgi:hypothetical protein